MRRWDCLVVVLPVALVSAGCAHGGRGGTNECLPPTEDAARVNADQLAGEYVLTMAATEGGRAGTSVVGQLELRPQHDSLRRLPGPGGAPYPDVTIPLVGAAAVAVDSVGAMVAGNLASADPMAPGVAVLDRPGETLLRLGSTGNRRGVFAFDGPSTVLRVHQVTADGFGGRWWSSGGDRSAEGYFCAVRRSS